MNESEREKAARRDQSHDRTWAKSEMSVNRSSEQWSHTVSLKIIQDFWNNKLFFAIQDLEIKFLWFQEGSMGKFYKSGV